MQSLLDPSRIVKADEDKIEEPSRVTQLQQRLTRTFNDTDIIEAPRDSENEEEECSTDKWNFVKEDQVDRDFWGLDGKDTYFETEKNHVSKTNYTKLQEKADSILPAWMDDYDYTLTRPIFE